MRVVIFSLFMSLFLVGCVANTPSLGTQAEKIVEKKSTKADVVQILGQPNSKISNKNGDTWYYNNEDYSDVVNIGFNKKGVVNNIEIHSSSKGSNSIVGDIAKDATNTLKNETSSAISNAIRGVFR